MANRIPPDAFEHYFSLGESRSYEAVAERYGVSKRAVTARAAKENWAERLASIEEEARAKSDERMAESISEMHARHAKTVRAIQARAMRAVNDYPLTSGAQGMRMLEVGIKLERLIRAEPNAVDARADAEKKAALIRGFVAAVDMSIPHVPPPEDDEG